MSAVLMGEVAALGAAVSWAVAPILYRQALFRTNPVSANIVRCVSNGAVMLIMLFALGWAGNLAKLPPSVITLTILSGVIGLGIGDTLYMVGLKSIGVSRAVPLAATYPLFSLIWATTLLNQSLKLTAILGAIIILVGIWLLSREKSDSTVHFKGKLALSGIGISLLTALVWSISITMMDVAVTMPGVSGVDVDVNFAILTTRIASMALLITIFAPVIDKKRGFLKMNRRTVIQLCAGGLAANAVGWLLMNYSFLNLIESQAVPISSTTPLFSAIAGFALFHEKMTRYNAIGVAIIVLGIFLIFIV